MKYCSWNNLPPFETGHMWPRSYTPKVTQTSSSLRSEGYVSSDWRGGKGEKSLQHINPVSWAGAFPTSPSLKSLWQIFHLYRQYCFTALGNFAWFLSPVLELKWLKKTALKGPGAFPLHKSATKNWSDWDKLSELNHSVSLGNRRRTAVVFRVDSAGLLYRGLTSFKSVFFHKRKQSKYATEATVLKELNKS